MTIDNDDALLDALGRGEPAPQGDTVAKLLAAWHSEISDIAPAALRPAAMPSAAPKPRRNRSASDRADGRTPTIFLPSTDSSGPADPAAGGAGVGPAGGAGGGAPSGPRRGAEPAGLRPPGGGPERGPRRGARPLIVAIAVAMLAFGGLAVASATAEPGSPLWPITKLMWSDKADSKLAEQEAQRLLGEARQALADKRSQAVVDLVTAAQKSIARVSSPAMKQQLLEEAEEILAQLRTLIGPVLPGQPGQPGATPPGATAAPLPTAPPDPQKTGLLPPILPSLLPSLPSLLPSLPLLG